MWETPSHDEIVTLTAAHVGAMETMDIDDVWQQAGMHHVLVRTIGRKSGNEHKVALPTWRDAQDRRVVVASFAGADGHPSWYLNLTANPEAEIQVKADVIPVTARTASDDEKPRVWKIVNEVWPNYDVYQTRTDRPIPVVVLSPT